MLPNVANVSSDILVVLKNMTKFLTAVIDHSWYVMPEYVLFVWFLF